MTTPYPGPRSILVLDNARIHHAQEIEDLIHNYGRLCSYLCQWLLTVSAGCRVEFLPPYSPDFNPIEQAFSVIKSHLRRIGLSFYHDKALYYEMYRACDIITADMTWGFFRHSGYI
jgi:transposase